MTDYKEKYPIGSQWETRSGERAVVVDYEEVPVSITVYVDCTIYDYCCNGTCINQILGSGYDLIKPWKDKKVRKVELVMFTDEYDDVITDIDLCEGQLSDQCKVIARKTVTITEGEGMD